MSAVAIPRFTAITTSANTAKVQADLSTLDTAIALYQMDYGKAPTTIDDLKDYVQDVKDLKSPKGNIYVEGNENSNLSNQSYSLKTDDGNVRAALGEYTSNQITKNGNNQ